MKLEELQVEIRPRTAGQTVAIAARMIQHRPLPILTAWLFYSAGTIGLALLLLWLWELHPAWAWVLVPLLAPIFSAPLVTTVGHLVFSPSVTFGVVARETTRRVLPFLALFLVNRVLVLLGLVLAIVPGLFLWRASWFLGPIVLLEGSPLRASFRRGRRFAIGFHGHVLAHAFNAAVLLLYLAIAGASLIHFLGVKVLGLTFSFFTNITLLPGYVHLVGLAGFALAAPLVTVIWFFVYLDVRTRKEGWDLEIAFRARAAQLERSHA